MSWDLLVVVAVIGAIAIGHALANRIRK